MFSLFYFASGLWCGTLTSPQPQTISWFMWKSYIGVGAHSIGRCRQEVLESLWKWRQNTKCRSYFSRVIFAGAHGDTGGWSMRRNGSSCVRHKGWFTFAARTQLLECSWTDEDMGREKNDLPDFKDKLSWRFPWKSFTFAVKSMQRMINAANIPTWL